VLVVTIVRVEPTADASFAAIRARSKFGIAIAAMIRMMATTISSSMSEKPFWFFFISVSPGDSSVYFNVSVRRVLLPDTLLS
jgi:hypothetical protein